MASSLLGEEVDFIQELRLRRWAREHYVPAGRRNAAWHPIVLEEMSRKDREVGVAEAVMELVATQA
jgi:hypothetical protein